MIHFVYKARDRQGELMNGVVEAADELMVVTNLSKLGYQVIHVEKQEVSAANFFKNFFKKKRVAQQELIIFTRQVSAMLKAGLPITSALSSVSQQIDNEFFSDIITKVRKDIERGISFSEALGKHSEVFNELFINMVQVGETAGILGEVLDRLVILNTQETEMRMRLQSAMVYPSVLVVVAISVVIFLLAFIIPKFVTIFETYDAKIPLATQILLAISYFIRTFWHITLITVAGSILWLKRYIKTKKGEYKFYTVLLKIPLVGPIYLKIIVSQFTRILGSLVKAGIPLLKALSVTGKTIKNVVISRTIQNISNAVAGGQSLSEPFQSSGIFPPMVIQMISAGEKSGKMDQMLASIALYYDQEVEYTLKNATTILEPVLLLVMGGIVGFIALAVLMPIFNLIKVFRGGV